MLDWKLFVSCHISVIQTPWCIYTPRRGQQDFYEDSCERWRLLQTKLGNEGVILVGPSLD